MSCNDNTPSQYSEVIAKDSSYLDTWFYAFSSISKTEFWKYKYLDSKDTFKEIRDINEAKLYIKNRVVFGEWNNEIDDYLSTDSSYLVLEIRPNGLKRIDLLNKDDYDPIIFESYFPELDIILGEGGHTTDQSYNLKTGEGTEQTGNPRLWKTSQSGQSRLIGYYGGQECDIMHVQKKTDSGYKNILTIDFDDLCNAFNMYWKNDSTLYASKWSNSQSDTTYHKITISRRH